MGAVAQFFGRAVGWHRQALGFLLDAEAELRALESDDFTAATADVEQRRRVARLHSLAQSGLRGWLGARLDGSAVELPLGQDAVPDRPMFLRVGDAQPTSDTVFWVVAPFIGAGHLAIDSDVRDPATAAWLRGVLLRVMATLPDGALRVLPVDGATLGSVFAAFRPMVEADAWAPPATDLARLRVVLEEAERQISAVQAGELDNPPVLLVAIAAMPSGSSRADWARLAAVAHAGPSARVHLLVAGWPPPTYGESAPRLDHTTHLTAAGDGWYRMSEPPGPQRLSADGTGLAAPVRLDSGASEGLVAQVCRRLAVTASGSRRTDFSSLMPAQIWQESSAAGLSAMIGRDGRAPFTLSLDDATPHVLLAGRSGAGKTNVLLVLLYALASRYSPDELGLYLLDFKEGVSFVEFTPTAADPSWVPHARTVGIESDREYGLAVLRALAREMNRRAGALKKAGATSLTGLRARQPDTVLPRFVVVIDEFQVLLGGNDAIAREAVAGLEDLARKGRSYGIHLILASQTIAGIEALYTKKDSIFGQFPLRIALPGGSGILDTGNTAADALPVGTAIVNPAAGVAEENRTVRFPYADPASVAAQRHVIWEARPIISDPPAVFAGYAEHHIDDDLLYAAFTPQVRRRQALVGRAVDVGLPTVGFALDAVPGRHLAVLGTSPVGADILHAAALSLARQHDPGTARFVIASFAAVADPVVDDLATRLTHAGHDVSELDAGQLRALLPELATTDSGPTSKPTYLLTFAADVVAPMLSERGPDRRTGLDDLRAVLRSGPGRGIHLLGWWRIARRFAEALGGSSGREDVACLVALNVPGNELASLLGDHTLTWQPRTNRALLIDRHDQRARLIVPFVRPGRHDDTEEAGLP
ncbi:FtsK/SpoIIIE domain-containing protein [Plantactinospora sp. GCM10030261]|uniref:FtsK/SpoIIIE domain-containing protein n=1 Tax=Plantactinospora sp. GCM10030261 TaxID=3273420 RepID=UPI003611A96F